VLGTDEYLLDYQFNKSIGLYIGCVQLMFRLYFSSQVASSEESKLCQTFLSSSFSSASVRKDVTSIECM
jgi:hypothetical protein